jgi:ParB/RepB/Spo0J family partition protein
VPDLDPRRSPVPPFVTARPPLDDDQDDLDADTETDATDAPRTREGLPPGYRMRHNAHYVDQLASRSAVSQVRAIPVRDIVTRTADNGHDLAPLSASIARHGVLQPLHVRARHGRFELIAGARRLGAAALAGLTEVPCIVHACDDAVALALGEADNLRPNGTGAAAKAPAPEVARGGFDELRRSLSTIESCLHLLDTRAAAFRDRVAIDLLRTEANRASRLVRCLAALAGELVMTPRRQPVRPVIDHVLEAAEPERRLAGVEIAVATDGAPAAPIDDEWFAVAIWAALGCMMALVQGARDAAVQVRVSPSATRASVVIEFVQRAARPPAPAFSKFFDPHWIERPGGYQAAVEAAAVRRLVSLHGGRAEFLPAEGGGCRLLLALPADA